MKMATRPTSKYHEENAELWDLLRRCQSRLAESQTTTTRYECNCSYFDTTARRNGCRKCGGDELISSDHRRKRVTSGDASPTRTLQEWEEAEDTILSCQEKKVLRDYKQEHCEVLDLLERSKERLSKIDFSKLEPDSRRYLDDGSPMDGRNSSSCSAEGVEQGKDLHICNVSDSFTITTIESTRDDSFDIFLDEHLDISYHDHNDDGQIECELFGFTFKFFRRQCPDFVTIL
mmetsp:Transcript_83/g.111  ORF Transcript_83/g.111 Transcript_83/m.111 type:complete len:232 (-) Transcript_83:27-722(-)